MGLPLCSDASAEGGSSAPLPPAATFASLPGRQVLTLNMDVPESWLVEAVDAEVRCRFQTVITSGDNGSPETSHVHSNVGICVLQHGLGSGRG